MRTTMLDLQTTNSILDTKGFLHTTLNTANQASNNTLICIILNILNYKFFRGVVGEQAEKSGCLDVLRLPAQDLCAVRDWLYRYLADL